MIYRYKWEIKLWIAAIAYIIWVVTSAMVHGDDTEDTDLRNCLLGDQRFCDKMEINKLHNQLLTRAEEGNGDIKICFATPELMAKFLEQNPDGKFNITVPCPEKKFSGDNESGK